MMSDNAEFRVVLKIWTSAHILESHAEKELRNGKVQKQQSFPARHRGSARDLRGLQYFGSLMGIRRLCYLAVISTEARVVSQSICSVQPLPDLSKSIVKFSKGVGSFETFMSTRASSSLSYL